MTFFPKTIVAEKQEKTAALKRERLLKENKTILFHFVDNCETQGIIATLGHKLIARNCQ